MTNAHSIKTTLLLAVTQLKMQRIDAETAKLEAQLLLQHALNVNRAWLIAHQDDALEVNIHAAYRAMLVRRLNGEPIAYILGYREFYGLKLKVTKDTLIPRADTETLVEAALAKIELLLAPSPQPSPTGGEGVAERDVSSSPSFSRRRESNLNLNQALNLNQKMDSRLRGNDERDGANSAREGTLAHEKSEIADNNQLKILDLGTGSGAIALSIAKHAPQAHITALDASQAALNIAIENAQNLNITNVKFILSDWFSALNQEKFDIIVSNPPYIEAADVHLKQGDLRFEPLAALASGDDGMDAIRHIIDACLAYLKPQGWLMLEHGYNQAELVAGLMAKVGFNDIETVNDLAGNPRVTLGKNPLIF
jgi:release factor glutamine methyltransferase